MVNRTVFSDYLSQLFSGKIVQDYCPNGLQVSGASQINTIVTGVSACLALLKKAASLKAQAILVHHGYFWKEENACLVGIKKERIKILLDNNINLFAYHLPLDLHPELGNNSQLAKRLGIVKQGECGEYGLVSFGTFKKSISPIALREHIRNKLGRTPLHILANTRKIKKIAWCTGAAQKYIELAASIGVDAYLTGEISEHTVHVAKESGIHFYACGHHATERYGVQAVGDHLAKVFHLKHHFIDIDNPV